MGCRKMFSLSKSGSSLQKSNSNQSLVMGLRLSRALERLFDPNKSGSVEKLASELNAKSCFSPQCTAASDFSGDSDLAMQMAEQGEKAVREQTLLPDGSNE